MTRATAGTTVPRHAAEASAPELAHRRWGVPLALIVTALLAVAALSGALTPTVFTLGSTTKWALLVAVPVAGAFLLATDRPVTYCACALIAATPVSSLEFSAPTGRLQLGWALSVATCTVAFLSSRQAQGGLVTARRRPTGLLVATGAVLLLLVPSTLLGSQVGDRLIQIATLAVFCYVLSRSAHLDRRAVEFLATTFVLMAAVEGVLALVQYATGHSFSAYGGGTSVYGDAYFFGYDGNVRPTGTFSDPISLGNVLALAVPIAFACAFGMRSFYGKLIHTASLLVIAAGLTVTLSRMSWIGAAAGVLAVIALSPARMWGRQVVGLVAGVAVAGSSIAAFAGPALRERFSSILDPTATNVVTASGDRTREQLWSAALHTFSDHPVLGVGFGNLVKSLPSAVHGASAQSHAHSTYFQYLSEAGVLGGLAILVLVLGAGADVRRISRVPQLRWIASAVGGALIALLVCWSTDYTIRYTPVLLAMAVPFVLAHSARRTQQGAAGDG